MSTSDCPEEKVLVAFSLGDLSEDARNSVAGHIDSCLSCDSKLKELRNDGTAVMQPDATLEMTPSSSDPAETRELQQTLDVERQESQPARLDQTIDSENSRVATSGDATGFTELNSLLEAKRGQTAPFKAERTLAQGGMGAVLVGRDKALQRRVAIKVMKPKIAESDEHRARFLEEAQITGQLEHPNIVPIHDLGKDADGNLYFSMKLVKGQSLGQILAEMKQGAANRSLTELLNIVLKIADGLAFAHSRGVVHRDLKPDNVMVGDFGEVLVMDWGLAKLLGRDGDASSLPVSDDVLAQSQAAADDMEQAIKSVRATHVSSRTLDGTIQGTPAYMPPEQALGKIDEIDQRSDVYSLGAILYEILTLERPVDGEKLSQLLKNAAQGNVVPPERRTADRFIPAELSAVAMKAMRFAREDRYQTVTELERDINLFLEGRAVSAKDDSLRESMVKLILRNKAVSSAVVTAAAIILVLATFSYIRITSERDLAIENGLAATQNAGKAKRNEDRALASEQEARDREREARASELKAIDAERQQRETALSAARQFALQTVELANVNQLDPAMRRAKDAEIVAPGSPWQYFSLGAIAMARQDYAGAAELYRTAASKPDGKQPEIAAALAHALARQGNLDEAVATISKLDEVDDWRILLGAGRVLYSAGKWAECQRPLARAIELMDAEKDRPSENLAEAKRLLAAAPAQLACVGFAEEIRNLPLAELQVRVADKINELDGIRFRPDRLAYDDAGDLRFNGVNMNAQRGPSHLYPLWKLPIVSLELLGSDTWDLSPLQGMPLVTLDISNCFHLTNVEALRNATSLETLLCQRCSFKDLSPLRDLNLKRLVLFHKRYESLDLTPLQGMPLEELVVNTADLAPLTGTPLKSLVIDLSDLSNLEPLRGMPLKDFSCAFTWVSDLEPLTGMPLKKLNINGTKVVDLSPVKGCPIETMNIARTKVVDVSPLAAMPLTELDLSDTIVTDLSGLKGARLQKFAISGLDIDDLSPLTGMPLTYFDGARTNVTNLAPLAGMPLTFLRLKMTSVADLRPLAGMPLEYLNVTQTNVSDLSPLIGAPLSDLGIFGCWIKDYSSLATMRNLNPEVRPQYSYLLGEISVQDFRDRYHEIPGKASSEDTPKQIQIYVAMKHYADSGPAEAIVTMEDYVQRWGTSPPMESSNVKPDFIETSLKRLREELATQANQPAEANAAP